jgi:succinate dehydrogenase/fumarate reductase flavoprotein subunit
VVVGAGGGGLPTALFSRWLGNSVVVLEKAEQVGGTARKAAFWYWVPNNKPMRELGLSDPKDDAIRLMARLSRPQGYDPDDNRYGMDDWEYAAFEAIYDSASVAAELLADKGALPYRHCPDVVDYWAELPENKAPRGRVLLPKGANEAMSDGGLIAIETMSAAAKRDGVEIRTSHRVQRVIRRDDSEIVGVEASTPAGTIRIRAKKAVIFVTGGFTHDEVYRRHYLHAPVYPGCGARTNEGDVISIANSLGAELRNMNYAWMCPAPLERILDKDPNLIGTFSSPGDSMIWVDMNGKRVVNEKLAYNEIAQYFFQWDGATSSYPNLVLVAIWDAHSQENSASIHYGRYIVPENGDSRHVIKANTLAELHTEIAARLEKHKSVTGGLALKPAFLSNLGDTIQRFNDFARAGKDQDFQRGERPIELQFNGPIGDEAGANPTMYPIANKGPYYATLMTGATLDTKGGPRTTTEGHFLDDMGNAIPGLYGVGNCVASASGRSYWAGGATLGPIIAFAYRAAHAASAEDIRSFSNTAQAAE